MTLLYYRIACDPLFVSFSCVVSIFSQSLSTRSLSLAQFTMHYKSQMDKLF